MRIVSFVASLAVVLAAAFVVPMPFERTVPGRARPVEDLVTVSGAGEINGDLALLTVRDVDATPVDLVVAALRRGQQLEPVPPRGSAPVDDRVVRELMAQQFANSFTTAVAVAAETAGYPVDVSTEVAIGQVLPDGPSDGVLEVGDVVVAVGDTPVSSAAGVVAALGELAEPVPIDLTIERDDETRVVTIETEVLATTGRVGVGVVLTTLTAPVELPFDVQLAESNIIGPSAGLMIAVTVADLLLDEDLAAGRRISGTGTIDGTGAVGPIASIEQKVEAAVDAGSVLMLAPVEQAETARIAADGRIEVVGVASLVDALDVLRGDAVASP